jgi:hypothetical protein
MLVRVGFLARELRRLRGHELHERDRPELAHGGARLALRLACVARRDGHKPARDRLVAFARAPRLAPVGKALGRGPGRPPSAVDEDHRETGRSHQHGESAERRVEAPTGEFDARTARRACKPRDREHRDGGNEHQ